jgi:hypothetical protein
MLRTMDRLICSGGSPTNGHWAEFRAMLAAGRPGCPAHPAMAAAAAHWLERCRIVQPARPVGSSDGLGVPRSADSPTATRKSSSGRPCCRQGATTVRSRSPNRLPASLSDPKLPFRQSTAGRKAHSAPLLVGSTPSTRANVHRAGHHLLSSPQSAAAVIVQAPQPDGTARSLQRRPPAHALRPSIAAGEAISPGRFTSGRSRPGCAMAGRTARIAARS